MSPTKGFYHCFGCGEHGTAIGFLMAYDNLGFPEAVEALAEMLGMEVPRETGGARRTPRRARRALRVAARGGSDLSRGAAHEPRTAIAYLKKRGIDGATAGRFGMGYAPAAWDTVLRALGTSEARHRAAAKSRARH